MRETWRHGSTCDSCDCHEHATRSIDELHRVQKQLWDHMDRSLVALIHNRPIPIGISKVRGECEMIKTNKAFDCVVWTVEYMYYTL